MNRIEEAKIESFTIQKEGNIHTIDARMLHAYNQTGTTYFMLFEKIQKFLEANPIVLDLDVILLGQLLLSRLTCFNYKDIFFSVFIYEYKSKG